MDIKKQISGLKEELVELRRDFHRHPEPGFQEYRTSEIVEKYLTDLGLPVKRMAQTGVVGLLEGENHRKTPGSSLYGPTLLLRADMDALPIQEQNDIPYKSENQGVMHACGHDAHVAMLLVAAKVLMGCKQEIPGNIKFVFQPNEETAGAEKMINEGVMENPRVDAAMAVHIWSLIESGKIGTQEGPVTGTLDVFNLLVKGKGGHTGFPEATVDPILTSASIIQAVQAIQTRQISPLKPTILMFGKISGGTKSNIVPDQVSLEGTLRYLYRGGSQSQERPVQRFENIVKHTCEMYGADYQLEVNTENKAVFNDGAMAALAKRTAEQVLGKSENVLSYSCTAAEDFSEYAAMVPSVFSFVGTGNKQKKTDYPHHNPRFNIDEDTMPLGVEMHVRGALNYFREKPKQKGGDG
ncbi:MAG: M20 metallopeptidase family protein [Spirochaetota bacterium]